MKDSNIAWTDHTFNPIWGCTKVSPGCANCYAESLAGRFGFNCWGPHADRRTFGDKHWAEPLEWNKTAADDGQRRRVFCGSMCDWAEENPYASAARPRLVALMRATPHLDWLLLTKRADRIATLLPFNWGDGWPNVWLGVTVENNDYIWRADHLRKIPAVVRFISYEPALGPVPDLNLSGIDWLICGGESGPNYRPMRHEWARLALAKARAAGTAFFFKQSSGLRSGQGIELDGQVIREFPKVREGER